MQDRVGSVSPSEEQATSWATRLHEIKVEMTPYCVGLTTDERKHALRFRRGGERIVAALGSLVRKHNVALPGINADQMEADLRLAERLAPVQAEADELHQLVDDTILEARAESWYAATAFYTTLSRMVSAFPDIKNPISDIAAFFTSRRKKPGEPEPTE